MDIKCFFRTVTAVLRADGFVEGNITELNEKAENEEEFISK